MARPKAMKPDPDPEILRRVAWDLGSRYPEGPVGDYLAFAPIRAGLAYLHWSMLKTSVRKLQEELGEAFNGSSLALRIYDVTLVDFDGSNAHGFFDVHVEGLSGRYYLHSDQMGRSLMAEVGFRLLDGRFFKIARSVAVFMDPNARAGHSDTAGLYVSGRFDRVFPVENVFEAGLYERVHESIGSTGGKTLQVWCASGDEDSEVAARLSESLGQLHGAAAKFGVDVSDFPAGGAGEAVPDLIHVHNAGSVESGLKLAKKTGAPLVFSLHSTEQERAANAGRAQDPAICLAEAKGIERADFIIVPHADLRQQLISDHEVDGNKVGVVGDLFESVRPQSFDPGEVKKRFHLSPVEPLALFSGEISHAAGADILIDAIFHVAGNRGDIQFVLVGEGPLRGELEGRIHEGGLGGRVRFTGHLPGDLFHELLEACDFLVIPARTWQDEGLAHLALERGKPVLATHQSRIHCVRHGENGLMVYDNPGSIIWGIQESLEQPFSTGPGGIVRRPVNRERSFESVAAELCVIYRTVINDRTGSGGGAI